MDEKYSSTEVEVLEAHKKATKPVVGDITLFDEDGGIILVPTPTDNPNGKTALQQALDLR